MAVAYLHLITPSRRIVPPTVAKLNLRRFGTHAFLTVWRPSHDAAQQLSFSVSPAVLFNRTRTSPPAAHCASREEQENSYS